MFWRFYRSFRIKGNLFLNISKRGLSLTYRGRPIKVTWNKHGLRFTTGLRGTGLSFTELLNS